MKIVAKFGSERLKMKSDWDFDKVASAIKEAKALGYYELTYSLGAFIVPFEALYWEIED